MTNRLWEFKGGFNSIIREIHDKTCTCSYCRELGFGLIFPKCKARNSWRIIKWKWRDRVHILRWTLPRKRKK